MTPPSPTLHDLRAGAPAPLWSAPRVTHVAVARPGLDVDVAATPPTSGAVEWLPRSTADRRL